MKSAVRVNRSFLQLSRGFICYFAGLRHPAWIDFRDRPIRPLSHLSSGSDMRRKLNVMRRRFSNENRRCIVCGYEFKTMGLHSAWQGFNSEAMKTRLHFVMTRWCLRLKRTGALKRLPRHWITRSPQTHCDDTFRSRPSTAPYPYRSASSPGVG